MSLKKRRIIMALCFLAFFALIPPLFYFVTGYRIGHDWSFVETGGIYIGADRSGSEIFINAELEKTTNLLQNGLFLQGLKPAKYNIIVAKEKHWPWTKDLIVRPHLVVEARAFNLSKEPKSRILKQEDVSALGFSEYEEALTLFNAQIKLQKDAAKKPFAVNATSTEAISKNNKQRIYIEGGKKIWAEWLGEEKSIPYYFCDQDNKCNNKVLVLDSQYSVRNVDFFPGRRDLVMLSSQNGVFATEIDGRGGRMTQPIYKGKEPTFALSSSDSGIYIFDDNHLIKIEEI